MYFGNYELKGFKKLKLAIILFARNFMGWVGRKLNLVLSNKYDQILYNTFQVILL